jgi:hypothetical protein
MSRRNLSEPMYGQIELKCPHKHELGAILVQPRRRPPTGPQTLHRLSAVMKAPKITRRPDGELEMPEPDNLGDLPMMQWGAPVSDKCGVCGHSYQAPWEMVEPAIAQLADSPLVKLTLYDRPLC